MLGDLCPPWTCRVFSRPQSIIPEKPGATLLRWQLHPHARGLDQSRQPWSTVTTVSSINALCLSSAPDSSPHVILLEWQALPLLTAPHPHPHMRPGHAAPTEMASTVTLSLVHQLRPSHLCLDAVFKQCSLIYVSCELETVLTFLSTEMFIALKRKEKRKTSRL